MGDRVEKTLNDSLLNQYSFTRNRGAKEEALALLSFQKTKLEGTAKKYKVIYYIFVVGSFLSLIYSIVFLVLWILTNMHLFSEENKGRCDGTEFVMDSFIAMYVFSLLNLPLVVLAGRKERRKIFFIYQIYIVFQLVGRILIYAQYSALTQTESLCPYEEYTVASKNARKIFLVTECTGDTILLLVCSSIIWLLHKIKSKRKLFSLMGKTQSLWEL